MAAFDFEAPQLNYLVEPLKVAAATPSITWPIILPPLLQKKIW
jgi:hypothetical protein